MKSHIGNRYAAVLSHHSRLVIILMLLATIVMGAGIAVGDIEDGGIGEFEVDDPATEALAEIRATYGADETVITQVVVREPDGNVLDRDSLLEALEFQEELLDDPTIADTLIGESPIIGFENIVGTAAYQAASSDAESEPTVAEQRAALADLDDQAVSELTQAVLVGDVAVSTIDPARFLPTDRVDGSPTSDARVILIGHLDDGGPDAQPTAAFSAQRGIEKRFHDRFDDGFVFGQGIVDAASSAATGDSFIVITPVALILVLGILGVAYRDPADILIALGGIGVVMVWLGGIMGWLSIPMSQLLIAVPFLLIGLSIDYALHVFMRYREARAGRLDDGIIPDESERIRWAMTIALGGVILALAAATISTGVGFLSNYVSPLAAVRDFALLSGLGIFATFAVFGILIPAVKVEVDTYRDETGKQPAAFGIGTGVLNRVLTGVVSVVSRAPLLVIALAFLLTVGGVVGAAGIDTEFNEADFLPQDAPEWAKSLPGPFAVGTYTVADDSAYLAERFAGSDERSRSQVLIRDGIADPEMLASLADLPGGDGAIVLGADGQPSIQGPLTVITALADQYPSVQTALDERDTTGDGIPNEDVTGLYDVLYEADSELASSVIHRSPDGTYESLRLLIAVRGDASAQAVSSDTQVVADAITERTGVTAVATGDRVISALIQDALLDTLIQAFVITFFVILGFLTMLYFVRHGRLDLGAITLSPVLVALAVLLGVMALLEIPYNSETAVITGLAIGLGVDYSIHLGERITAELEHRASLTEALEASITGTGGALLGSALTTASGFAVLAFSLAPPIRRFGLVTATAIGLAFIACITVLPALFILRERITVRLRKGS